MLVSTADFAETWQDKSSNSHGDMSRNKKHYSEKIDHSRRPVVGVLTEPLRGELVNETKEERAYVPRAHVQFLEQAGLRVVPVDHRLPREEIIALLD